MPATEPPTLILTVQAGTISRLAPLLQRGFLVPCPGQVTLYDFLPGLPGFDREYITSRIETIFINGCAADSLETTISCRQHGCPVGRHAGTGRGHFP